MCVFYEISIQAKRNNSSTGNDQINWINITLAIPQFCRSGLSVINKCYLVGFLDCWLNCWALKLTSAYILYFLCSFRRPLFVICWQRCYPWFGDLFSGSTEWRLWRSLWSELHADGKCQRMGNPIPRYCLCFKSVKKIKRSLNDLN